MNKLFIFFSIVIIATYKPSQAAIVNNININNDNELVKKNDVEFHLSLCGQSFDQVRTLLFTKEVNVLNFQERKIYYFDTDQLTYYKAGIIFRARFKGKYKADFTTKLRPFSKENILASWENNHFFRCEKDFYLKAFTKSCRLKEKRSFFKLSKIIKNKNYENLINYSNIRFVNDHKNIEIDFKKIKLFGPVPVQKIEFLFKEQVWILENWQIGKKNLLELSFKSSEESLKMNKQNMLQYLKFKKITYCSGSNSKTKRSLEYFLNKN